MEFEYESAKSASNAEKHGIDFGEAQALWEGDTVEFQANVKGERRSKVVGRIGGGYWAAIVTDRDGRTRIISVRRATPKERSAYDRHVHD